jgi:hypothetical protein
MYRHAQQVSEKQYQLALGSLPNRAGLSRLRAAFERLKLSRKFTFEQAMSIPVFAIGIRNMADAMAHAARSRQVHFDWGD